jgi:peptide/nickel transport system substrate-binding protein
MNRQRPYGALAMLVGLLLLCLPGISEAQAPAPRRGGALIIVDPADPTTLNPALTTAVTASVVTSKMFNALIGHDWNGNPIPDLARSWSVADNGLSMRFDLVRNAQWHDGKPLTSADVKFTYEEAILKYHPLGKTALAALESVQTPDPYTVVFRLKFPAPALMSVIGLYAGSILPKHLYEGTDVTKNPHNDRPVGSGPFMFKEWVKGSHIALERNPRYFKSGKPYLDRIVFRIIPDASARVLAFEAGEVDYLPYFATPLHEVGRLRAMKDTELVLAPGFSAIYNFWFNLRKAPFNDLRVRQAIAHGLDKQVIFEKAAFGIGKAATGPIASATKWAYNASVPTYPRDVVRANRLLDEAGLKRGADGMRFKMAILTDTGSPVGPQMADIIRDQLREIGIDAEARRLDSSTLWDKMFVQWDFDTAIQEIATGPDPAIGVSRLYVSSNIRKVPFTNGAGYSNPEVDALFEQGAREPNAAKRAAIYRKVQEIIVRDLPMVWIWEQAYPVAWKKRFEQGLTTPFSNFEPNEDTWLRQ